MAINEKYVGSSFDDFLEEQGMTEEINRRAMKNVIALELEKARKKSHISKKSMAKRMKTSRSAVERVLDPSYSSIRLDTLQKAAHALGCSVYIAIRPTELSNPKSKSRKAQRKLIAAA